MKAFVFAVLLSLSPALFAQQYRQQLVLPKNEYAIWAVRIVNRSGQVAGTFDLSGGVGNEVDNAFLWSKTLGFVDLATLGGNNSIFTGLNDAGQVIGTADLANGKTHAFRWTGQTGMRDLGSLGGAYSYPVSINASGQVAGWSYIKGEKIYRAFLWSPGGKMTDIGAGDNSQATAINDKGEVVGYFWDATAQRNHGFLWSKSGGLVILDPPGSRSTQVNGLNNMGEAVGIYYNGTCECEYVWTADTGYHTITTDISQGGLLINNSGEVAGFNGPNNLEHAYTWTIAGGRQDLGTLPGFANSYPVSLTNKGEVLGYSCSAGAEGCQNFVWLPASGIRQVGQWIGPGPDQGMNDAGQILMADTAGLHLITPVMHVKLSSSPNPATAGQTVTFTATITSVEGAPPDGELATFYLDGKKAAQVATHAGVASFQTSSLKAGTHPSSALYQGDVNYFSSYSSRNQQVINP